ncbi:uncharacterized protein [Venturia canescens]|uniref:uncharacterized protein n=1 Tax=Venturia canescens TaxID=32260 RepID=UPI001C9D4D45|nr:uncharacterized protein LOC122416066 [Venturia canescens]
MPKLTNFFGAVVLFAVVTKETVTAAAVDKCDKKLANSHFDRAKKFIDDSANTVTNGIEEGFGLTNKINGLEMEFGANLSNTLEHSLMETLSIMKNTKTAVNKTECMRYFLELQTKGEIIKNDVSSYMSCVFEGRVNRLLSILPAMNEAQTALHNLKSRVRSCSGRSCCEVLTRTDAIRTKFYKAFSVLSCTDKLPMHFAGKAVRDKFKAFKQSAQEAVQRVYSCVHHTQP